MLRIRVVQVRMLKVKGNRFQLMMMIQTMRMEQVMAKQVDQGVKVRAQERRVYRFGTSTASPRPKETL